MSKRLLIKRMMALSLCFCSITVFSACDGLGGIFPFMNSSTQESMAEGVTLSVVKTDQPVSLVYSEVTDYLSADSEQLVTDFLPMGSYRHDQGKPFSIEYDLTATAEVPDVERMVVEMSFDKDFSNVVHKEAFTGAPMTLDVYNLQTDATYYYRVTAEFEDGSKVSAESSVKTDASPRMLNISGASNVRDIGGWKTEDGKTIKQGVLYRGGEIDGGKNTGHRDFCLDGKGIKQLRGLGIKTDFDLRSESVKVGEYSVLGADVTRNFYNAAQYQSILESQNAKRTKQIFSDLAKPEAYPVYLHCTHGVDRAGSTVLILEALLGVGKVDLVRDYELSAFYHNYKHVNRNMDNGGSVLELIEGLETYQGETLAEKTASFLLSIGVTQDEIDSIRNIFLS